MKKIIIILSVLVIICVAGLAIFVATFDINAHRDSIAGSVSDIIGNTVEIDHLSLAWRGQVVMGADGFRVLAKDGAVAMSVDHADAALEVMPLLQRRVKISSIAVFRPKISIVREKSGSMRISGIDIKQPATQTGQAAAGQPALPVSDLKIKSIKIREGAVDILDLAADPASEISIKELNADINNVSMNGPVDFSISGALAGDSRNFEIQGRSGGFMTGDIYVKDLAARLDLNSLSKDAFFKAFPSLSSAGLNQPPAGELKAAVKELNLSAGKPPNISADADFTGGRLLVRQIPAPIEDIAASLSMEGETLSIKSFSARLANGTVFAKARADNVFTVPETTLESTIKVKGLSAFIQSVTGTKQNIDGNLELSFEGSMTGAVQLEIQNSLSGKGALSLEEGVIVDTNIIADSLGAMTLFPGLLDSLYGLVPPEVKRSFGERYTVLKPMSRSFTVEKGYIVVPDLVFETDLGDMRGTGTMSFTGDLTMKGFVELSESISRAIEKAVSQMQSLRNSRKRIEFPVTVKSGSDGFRVIPDLKYIATKVAFQKGEEMVSGFLDKASGQTQTTPSGQAAGEQGQPSALNDMMKNIKSLASGSQISAKAQ